MHILFAGSIVDEVIDDDTAGIVWWTGFATTNGRMIKVVLIPHLEQAKIEKDLSFILLIMIFLGIVGAVLYLICELAIVSNELSNYWITLRALELITNLVPAFLPLCLTQSNYYGMLWME